MILGKAYPDWSVSVLRYGVQPGTIVKVSCLSNNPASAAAAEEPPAETEAEVSHLTSCLTDYEWCILLAEREALLWLCTPAVHKSAVSYARGHKLLLCHQFGIQDIPVCLCIWQACGAYATSFMADGHCMCLAYKYEL